MKQKVLITGGAGFIGSHLAESLVKKDYEVHVLIKEGNLGSLNCVSRECFNEIKIVRGDLEDLESLSNALKGIEIVFHLAGLVSIPESFQKPREYFKINAGGTMNLLECARKENLKKIILVSSCEVYKESDNIIDENSVIEARSPYSASKIAAEKIAESYSNSYNLPVVIIRLFNTYGARQSKQSAVSKIIKQLKENSEIHLEQLIDQKRDFVYIDDSVEALIKAAESEKCIGETINIGTGKAFTLKEIIEILGKIMDKKIIITTDKPGYPKKGFVCNNSKAKHLLGWSPKTSIEDGFKEFLENECE